MNRLFNPFQFLFAAILIFFTYSCQKRETSQIIIEDMPQDSHSFALPTEAVITHLDWKADINFEQEKIKAIANYQIKKSDRAEKIVFDSKGLIVHSVKNGNNETLSFDLGKSDVHLGQPLSIQLTPDTKTISISYETGDGAEALQWLNPQQTADQSSPFLFTQSQAILARSWIPVQDSPGIRFTYNAEVAVPKGMLALMSATNPKEVNSTGTYLFNMDKPIPAYLLALAVGSLEYEAISDRSGIYAEPSLLALSVSEFEDLEKMILAAEDLYGAYRWDQYDLIVLPPSFPFGGMENPMLTFATPTILAGDKSLTSLVAHELAHSWSGNLVTNATWDDFWLNEGFTVYFEYRIMEALYGQEYAEMLALLSLEGLKGELGELDSLDTHLKLDLEGRSPDDGMTSIAYDKGYFFLRTLEKTAGRERFDDFMKAYFAQNAFQSMTTERFIEILKSKLIDEYQLTIGDNFINSWIYGSGLPDNCSVPSSRKFKIVKSAVTDWQQNKNPNNLVEIFHTDEWSTHEWLHFIHSLPDSLGIDQMSLLDEGFRFTDSGNSEIFAAWAELIIKNSYETGYPQVEEFLIKTGRRKFLTPLYTAMISTDEGKVWAQEVYQKARPNYHSVSSISIDKLLGIN